MNHPNIRLWEGWQSFHTKHPSLLRLLQLHTIKYQWLYFLIQVSLVWGRKKNKLYIFNNNFYSWRQNLNHFPRINANITDHDPMCDRKYHSQAANTKMYMYSKRRHRKIAIRNHSFSERRGEVHWSYWENDQYITMPKVFLTSNWGKEEIQPELFFFFFFFFCHSGFLHIIQTQYPTINGNKETTILIQKKKKK